jgi:hypothetical protein
VLEARADVTVVGYPTPDDSLPDRRPRMRRWYPAALLWAAISIPGIEPTKWSVPRSLTFLAVTAIVFAVGFRWVVPLAATTFSNQRLAKWTLIAVVALIGLATIAIYPHYPRGGPHSIVGNDNPDALWRGAQAILHGRFPYFERTWADLPLSPMPGLLLMAIPFVVLHHLELLNVTWIAVAVFAAARWWKSYTPPLLALGCLAISPTWWKLVAAGSDIPTTGLSAAVLLLAVAVAVVSHWSRWQRALLVLLCGIALSSRPNFILLLVPLAAYLFVRVGLRRMSITVIAVGAAAAAVTLPWYFAHPRQFTPFQTTFKLEQFRYGISAIGPILIAITILATVLAAVILAHRDIYGLALACAASVGAPVIVGLTIGVVQGQIPYDYAAYGYYFTWFAAFTGWSWYRSSRDRPVNRHPGLHAAVRSVLLRR